MNGQASVKELKALVRATLSSLESAKGSNPDAKFQLQSGFSLPLQAGNLSVDQAETVIRKFYAALTLMKEVGEATVVVTTNSFTPGLSMDETLDKLQKFNDALGQFKDDMVINMALNVMEDSVLTTQILTDTRSSYEAAQKLAADQEEAGKAKAQSDIEAIKQQAKAK